MNSMARAWQPLSAGLYAWAVTTFSGAVLLDIVYSRVAARDLVPSESAAMFAPVALLVPVLQRLQVEPAPGLGMGIRLAGSVSASLLALAGSWKLRPALS